MVKFTASVEAKADDTVMQFVMCGLEAVTNTHIQHWTTTSYAKHQALGEFYESMQELIDTWVEAFMGKYGVLTAFPTASEVANVDPIAYLQELNTKIAQYRAAPNFPKDTELQNLTDEIVAQIDATLYKLTRLN